MRILILASIASLVLGGAAFAQTTAPATKAAKPAAASSTAKKASKPGATSAGRKPMTAESKACSDQADAKKLHGKDREKFRRTCMKGKS